MKIITWEWRKQVMVDYFVFSWLQFSRHFKENRQWSWSFHWKHSNAWYHNFRRHVAHPGHGFKSTRLTIRFGKRLMVIGSVDMKRYYKDVKVLEIKDGGKILPLPKLGMAISWDGTNTPWIGNEAKKLYPQKGQFKNLPEDVQKTVDDMKKGYEHLSKDYPNDSWRN